MPPNKHDLGAKIQIEPYGPQLFFKILYILSFVFVFEIENLILPQCDHLYFVHVGFCYLIQLCG